jgi:RimJ/RimL family protein N-acetyltransferase
MAIDPLLARLPHRLERIGLRFLRADDLRAFHAYRSDPVVARYQGWDTLNRAQAAEFIAEQADTRARNPLAWRQVAIADLATDGLVGDLGIWLAHDASRAEFGVSLSPGAQRRGLATEAVGGLIGLIFDATGAAQVVARADTRNASSLALLRRVGMRHVDTVAIECKGELCTEHVFSLARAAHARAGG